MNLIVVSPRSRNNVDQLFSVVSAILVIQRDVRAYVIDDTTWAARGHFIGCLCFSWRRHPVITGVPREPKQYEIRTQRPTFDSSLAFLFCIEKAP